ncbi:MAG: gliding motility protein GldL [Lutibacter sp.]|uniref:type IX secretion system motor protein PorL/GldL n=1 Tax=Lutibacter sp. TaxID=1925666 RepID=UPI0017BC865E|nr:gliding motility protein GldL [Lutibacter sp.]MBT8316822.1 gliding motility protein GldL [Lutibacter sp.]NNJ57682.1 gliding motility protein GldL [Lutibacter sp.]
MAQSRNTKKLFNYAYGIGASIVILGALFKIQHWTGGGMMLSIGMIVEALVFFVSAFDSVEEDLDWSLVYPELSGGQDRDKDRKDARESQSLLSQKLDTMLKDAKLDAGLMQSLGDSIQSFKGAAENIAPAVDSIAATNRYSEQMSMAAAQMESLNSLYKVQLESSTRQAEINDQVVVNSEKLKEQMESLATNLSSLNGVYGGMLSAMSKNN